MRRDFCISDLEALKTSLLEDFASPRRLRCFEAAASPCGPVLEPAWSISCRFDFGCRFDPSAAWLRRQATAPFKLAILTKYREFERGPLLAATWLRRGS
jgi:hypothetical protein